MPKFHVRKNIDVYTHINSDHYLEVAEGPFEGMHFNLGRIEFIGEDTDGNGQIEFDYDLLLVPAGVNLDEQKKEVEQTISDVLHIILEQMVNNSKAEGTNETGNNDTQQSAEG